MSRSAVIIIINRYQTCCLHLGCFRGLCIHKHSQTMWRQLDPLSLYTRASSSSSSYLSPMSSRCTHTQTSTSAHAGVQPTVRRHRSVCETGPFLTGSTQPQNKKYKFFLSFFLGSAAQKQHLTRTCAPRVKKVKTCWYDDDTPSSSTEMRSLSAPVDTCKTRRRLSFCCKERHRRKRSGAGRDDNARPQTTTGLLLLLYFGLRPKRRRRNDFQVRVINTPAAAAAVVTCRSLARQYVIYTREPKSFFLSCKRKKKKIKNKEVAGLQVQARHSVASARQVSLLSSCMWCVCVYTPLVARERKRSRFYYSYGADGGKKKKRAGV